MPSNQRSPRRSLKSEPAVRNLTQLSGRCRDDSQVVAPLRRDGGVQTSLRDGISMSVDCAVPDESVGTSKPMEK